MSETTPVAATDVESRVEALHPNPQLARLDWVDLCGEWEFAFDDADEGIAGGWANAQELSGRIIVPFPPEAPASGIGDPSHHPVVWYRRQLEVVPPGDGSRIVLHVGACDYEASIWLNGHLVGRHEGGHTPFAIDLTEALEAAGERQNLVLRVVDRLTDPSQPRGKQDWRVVPHDIWYHRTTGIWQPVWLERVSRVHVSEVRWRPSAASAKVDCLLVLSHAPESDTRVRVRLHLGSELLADQTALVHGDIVTLSIPVPALENGQDHTRLLWAPETPVLVEAEISVLGDAASDEVRSYFGVRDVAARDGRFLLNGKPYFLRMVLEQGYWPESHLASPSPEALRREVELIKELGFNGIRIHQKIEDPRFLYWCDRLGLIVWAEMPSCYGFTPTSVQRIVTEWMEVVARDASHPSIAAWVPLNESWGVQDVANSAAQRSFSKALYHLTRALDPTRLVLSNDGWEHTESDLWTIHDYAPTAAELRERYGSAESIEETLRSRWPATRRVILEESSSERKPVVLSEFGGITLRSNAQEVVFGYGSVATNDELLERFATLVGELLGNPHFSGFCYTQLTDTVQERNGLLDERRVPKVEPFRIRAALMRPAAAVPLESIARNRDPGSTGS